MFAEKGYSGSTFRDICEEAGSNIASINYYFNDKEGFYAAVNEYARNLYRERMQHCLSLIDSDPWGALKVQIETLLNDAYNDTFFLANWFRLRELVDISQLPEIQETPECAERRAQYESTMMRLLKGLLGEAATPENIKLLRYTYLSLCQYLPIHRQVEEKKLKGRGYFNITDIPKDVLVDFVLGMVRRTADAMKAAIQK